MVTVIYSATRLAWLFGRGAAKIASTVLFMFACITMGVVPLAQINTGIFTKLIEPTTRSAPRLSRSSPLFAMTWPLCSCRPRARQRGAPRGQRPPAR